MRKLAALAILLLVTLSSCKDDCGSKSPACSDTPPADQLCQAYFERWFYNEATNSCEKKAYSGCSQAGFATEQECKACKCR